MAVSRLPDQVVAPPRLILVSLSTYKDCVDLNGTCFCCGLVNCERWWGRAGCGALWNLPSFLCKWKNEYAHFLLGNCLLQRAAEAGNEAAALFLATNGAHVNHRNKWVSVTGQPSSSFGLWKKWRWWMCKEKRRTDSFFSFFQNNTCT